MPSLQLVKHDAQKISGIKHISDLCHLLKVPQHQLLLLSQKANYAVYEIPKRNGKYRLIEDPEPTLKKHLQVLNKYLQAFYYAYRSKAVYGFCIKVGNEEDRNIINNACQHQYNAFMFNIDLQDFFHSVTQQNIASVYFKYFKNYGKELAELLTRLVCYNGRLPMGSPTSPVLSNIACIALDEQLLSYCDYSGITYTRYADDLTFSSAQPITKMDEEFIRDKINRHNFIVNEQKVKRYLPNDRKLITGIELYRGKLRLPDNYMEQLKIEIERLRQTMLVERRYRTGMSIKKLQLFKQELDGKWQFAHAVMPEDETIYQLKDEIENAFNPPENFESVDWLDMPYSII